MHRKSTKVLLAVAALFLFYGTISGAAPKKKESSETAVNVLTAKLNIPKAAVKYDSEIFKPFFLRYIPKIMDFTREIDFSDTPEEYDIWSDTKVNPYQVDLKDMKDTVRIDLSGFAPLRSRQITSDFGFRKWRHHYGIDLKVDKGDTVACAFDGVVRITKRARDYGYYVLVRHFNGLETLYAHLSKILVNPGDTLKSGTFLGLGGSTGRSTGNHLHFETRYLGNPINPNDLIDFLSYKVKTNIFQLNAKNFSYKKEIAKIRFWTIRRGDTLGRIAMRTGVSVSKLCSLNGLRKSSLLRIGRRLRYT